MYRKLPACVKAVAALPPYAFLAGRGYRASLALCQRLDSSSRGAVLSLQKQLLASLLHFVVNEVPFYHPFRDVVDHEDPFDALARFPLLVKGDIQKRFDELVPRSIGRIPHHAGSTGGSSGEQLVFLEDDSTYAREMGFMHSQWKRVGYKPSCRKATFRGVRVEAITDTCFWQSNPIHNELQFSPFHMNEGTLGFYVRKLIEYRPQFLHGYPSAVDVLGEYVIRHGLTPELPPIKAALLGSEPCSENQRDRIEAAFRTRVYTWYGHSERVVLGGECEHSQVYHAFPAYGVLEIIREDGEPCGVGEQGEIVGTGFLNRSLPLIRYRTDDYAVKESHDCQCGRCWDRFSRVMGRRSLEGVLVGRNGTRISDAALNMHGDCFKNVVRYQYYQETPGQLVIRVIPNPRYSNADEVRIVAAHKRKLWDEMDVLVRPVTEIPLTRSGKQRRILVVVDPSASPCTNVPPSGCLPWKSD